MWIVFGWDKEERPIGPIGEPYCYDCRRQSEWIVWNQSEWATLSALRVLKFINRHRLHCESCTFNLELNSREMGEIERHMRKNDSLRGVPVYEALIKRIESEQLATKTPLQIKFIRESMAAEREVEERLKQSDDDNALHP
jgi:hypothetical protein